MSRLCTLISFHCEFKTVSVQRNKNAFDDGGERRVSTLSILKIINRIPVGQILCLNKSSPMPCSSSSWLQRRHSLNDRSVKL